MMICIYIYILHNLPLSHPSPSVLHLAPWQAFDGQRVRKEQQQLLEASTSSSTSTLGDFPGKHTKRCGKAMKTPWFSQKNRLKSCLANDFFFGRSWHWVYHINLKSYRLMEVQSKLIPIYLEVSKKG